MQPTEQCVQTVFFISGAAPPTAASTGFTLEPINAEVAAIPPMASPEPRRNERRSTTFSATLPMKDDDWGRLATPDVFFLSIISSLEN